MESTSVSAGPTGVQVVVAFGARLESDVAEAARSKDSEGTTSRACNTGRDNNRGQAQIMDEVQTLFCLTDADDCREM